MINDTAHKLYQEWLKTDEGKHATEGTKACYQDWFALHNRRRYDEPLPDGVQEDRRKADELRKRVDEQESKLTGLFKQMTVSFGGLIHLDGKKKR
jgi:hypothetical protein